VRGSTFHLAHGVGQRVLALSDYARGRRRGGTLRRGLVKRPDFTRAEIVALTVHPCTVSFARARMRWGTRCPLKEPPLETVSRTVSRTQQFRPSMTCFN
jgi:hypothetical protein